MSVTELEIWHKRHDEALKRTRNPVAAVVEADTPEEQVKLEKERRGAICIIVPKNRPVIMAYDPFQVPTVMEYDEVWLSPHELRRVAQRKLKGETL